MSDTPVITLEDLKRDLAAKSAELEKAEADVAALTAELARVQALNTSLMEQADKRVGWNLLSTDERMRTNTP